MEDHTNTARVVVTACFSRAMRHYASQPPREPTDQDVYLYHAQPHMNRDGMRTLVVPELFVDVTSVMETKLRMLGCHESQRQWLDETQGLDDYLESMRRGSAEMAAMSGQPGWQYAEGFRRHSHLGFSACDGDPLSEGDVFGVRRLVTAFYFLSGVNRRKGWKAATSRRTPALPCGSITALMIGCVPSMIACHDASAPAPNPKVWRHQRPASTSPSRSNRLARGN